MRAATNRIAAAALTTGDPHRLLAATASGVLLGGGYLALALLTTSQAAG
ncbi:hypothetical protein [Dactylosporangium sp. NPDC049140]